MSVSGICFTNSFSTLNGVVHLSDTRPRRWLDVYKRQGLPFEAMLPLIDETARKVHELEPLAAQTGPAVRYDCLLYTSRCV